MRPTFCFRKHPSPLEAYRMKELCFYGYAEDALSCAVMRRLFRYRNETVDDNLRMVFNHGFPENKRGCGNLTGLIPKISAMARNAGLRTFVLTDLDQIKCAPELIRNWFKLSDASPNISENLLFRVAEREVEAWLLADRAGLSSFLGIAAVNFSQAPDSLPDPKQHLLNVIRSKGRKQYHKEMLPRGNAHVGSGYNSKLCEFVETHWNLGVARNYSGSLEKAIMALNRIASKERNAP